jgi:hypothetical protein
MKVRDLRLAGIEKIEERSFGHGSGRRMTDARRAIFF